MNSYLAIASKVLSEARQPLSAPQILRAAYDLQIVPRDLYGKTQHKTLQARIAEDILRNKGQSEFVRTERGRFFLRSLLSDPGVRRRFSGEYLAPIRADQLKRFYVACFTGRALRSIQSTRGNVVSLRHLLRAPVSYRLLAKIGNDTENYFLRVVVVLCRGTQVLLHRTSSKFGDSMDGRFSIGLIGFVKREDRTLFATDGLGIREAAERTLSEQLYMPHSAIKELALLFDISETRCIVDVENPKLENAIAAVVAYGCPTSKRFDELFSSLSTFEWRTDPNKLNDIDRFDRWSKYILEANLLDSTHRDG